MQREISRLDYSTYRRRYERTHRESTNPPRVYVSGGSNRSPLLRPRWSLKLFPYSGADSNPPSLHTGQLVCCSCSVQISAFLFLKETNKLLRLNISLNPEFPSLTTLYLAYEGKSTESILVLSK